MNKYKIKFYYTDNTNVETYLDSELEMEDFITDFADKNNNKKFLVFVNKGSIAINIDNVKYFTIDIVQTNITEVGE